MNNTTYTIVIISAPNITSAELMIQNIFFYGLLCGLLSTMGYISIVAAIAGGEKQSIRTRFMTFVAFLAAARALLCLQFLITAVYRSLCMLSIWSYQQQRIVCFALHFWLYHGLTLELLLLLSLVIDRLAAISMMLRYRHATTRQAVIQAISVYAIAILIKTVPALANGSDLFEVIYCANSASVIPPPINAYNSNSDLALLLLLLALYCLLIWLVKRRMRKVKEQQHVPNNATDITINNNNNGFDIKRFQSVLPTLRNQVVLHCLLSLTSKILLFSNNLVESRHSARMIAYGAILLTVDLFVSMIVLLFGNREIRQSFKKQLSMVFCGMCQAPSSTNTTTTAGSSNGAAIRHTIPQNAWTFTNKTSNISKINNYRNGTNF